MILWFTLLPSPFNLHHYEGKYIIMESMLLVWKLIEWMNKPVVIQNLHLQLKSKQFICFIMKCVCCTCSTVLMINMIYNSAWKPCIVHSAWLMDQPDIEYILKSYLFLFSENHFEHVCESNVCCFSCLSSRLKPPWIPIKIWNMNSTFVHHIWLAAPSR